MLIFLFLWSKLQVLSSVELQYKTQTTSNFHFIERVTSCVDDCKLAAGVRGGLLCEVYVLTRLSTGGRLIYLTDFTKGGEQPDYLSKVIKLFYK